MSNKDRLLHEYPTLEQEFTKSLNAAYNTGIDDVLNKIKASVIYPVEGLSGQFINKGNIINAIEKLKK